MKHASLLIGERQVIDHVELAVRWWQRMRGLLGRSSLSPRHAMFIEPANSIHTWFMRFPLDLVFVDRDRHVVRIVRNVEPWRMILGGKGAHAVVELAAGWLPEDAVTEGDALRFINT